MIDFVNEKWDPSTRLLCSLALALNWRLFLKSYGSAASFISDVSKSDKRDYLQKILGMTISDSDDFEREKAAGNTKLMLEALASRMATMFFGDYLLTLIFDDKKYRNSLANKLDILLAQGWSISLATIPLPDDEDRALNASTETFTSG